MRRILGIDPGLQRTGWGVVKSEGSTLSFVACGTIRTPGADMPLSSRLASLSGDLAELIERYRPQEAAIEETFVSVNGQSTLKLGQARGAILLTLAQSNMPAYEYAATLVKKSVSGAGRAEKEQVARMVRMLLPGCASQEADATDALAVAICHAHHGRLMVDG